MCENADGSFSGAKTKPSLFDNLTMHAEAVARHFGQVTGYTRFLGSPDEFVGLLKTAVAEVRDGKIPGSKIVLLAKGVKDRLLPPGVTELGQKLVRGLPRVVLHPKGDDGFEVVSIQVRSSRRRGHRLARRARRRNREVRKDTGNTSFARLP